MDQVPTPLVIGLDYTWYIKVAMEMCVFPSQVLVPTILFVPLNFASVSVKYNQILNSSFRKQGRGFHIFINNPTKMM